MSAILEVQNLRVEIPIATGTLVPVRGISFSVQRGETLCLCRRIAHNHDVHLVGRDEALGQVLHLLER